MKSLMTGLMSLPVESWVSQFTVRAVMTTNLIQFPRLIITLSTVFSEAAVNPMNRTNQS